MWYYHFSSFLDFRQLFFVFDIKTLIFKVAVLRNGGIYPIFARNTIEFLMVFRATTNHTGENGDKKQNTLPYPYKFKVVEVCLVGAVFVLLSELLYSSIDAVVVPSL